MGTIYSDSCGSSTVPTPAAAPLSDGHFPPAAAAPLVPDAAQAPPQALGGRIEARQSLPNQTFLSKIFKRNNPVAEPHITTTTSEPSAIQTTTTSEEPGMTRYGRIRIVGNVDSHSGYISKALDNYGRHMKCKLRSTNDALVVKYTGQSPQALLKARYVPPGREHSCLRCGL